MGNTQFYSPIKQSIDDIKTATMNLQTTVDALKNTDVSNLNTKVDNIGSFKNFPVIRTDGQRISPGGGTINELLSVTGSGVLTFALARFANAGGSAPNLLRLIVDGVNIDIGDLTSFNVFQGIGPILTGNLISGVASAIPPANSSIYKVRYAEIYFASSLKIQLINGYNSQNTMDYLYEVRTK